MKKFLLPSTNIPVETGYGFLFKGYNGSQSDDTDMYDMSADSWTDKGAAAPASSKGWGGWIVAAQRIVVQAAWNGGNLADLDSYNPWTDTWTPKTNNPRTSWIDGRAVGYSSLTYHARGRDQVSTTTTYDDIRSHNLSADTWDTSLASYATGKGGDPGCCLVNANKVVFVGGRTGGSTGLLDRVKYDIGTDTWGSLQNFSQYSLGVNSGSPNGETSYSFGGYSHVPADYITDNQKHVYATDTTSVAQAASTGVAFGAAFVSTTTVYSASGNKTSGRTDLVIGFNVYTQTWSEAYTVFPDPGRNDVAYASGQSP